MRLFVFACFLAIVNSGFGDEPSYTMDDFPNVEKIDIHAHIHTDNLDFVALSERDRFRFVNMAVWSNPDPAVNFEKHRTMFVQYAANPSRTAPVSSFPIENWDDDDFAEQAIRHLDETFAEGAVGVKVWKNIGMELRDRTGKLIMVDDARLDPIFDHIEKRGKILLGHLGEPKNCWLPLDEMTTNNDRSYFAEHPNYHMHRHPEMPSYEEQIAARDRMLEKHPNIRFIGCHLASLEWSVDAMAEFLERFPNADIGVAARMGQLQYQTQRSRDKVRAFVIKYQDRILYGTDTGIGPDANAAEEHASVRAKWLRDWKYFNTADSVPVPELDDPVQGLSLPKTVVDKIYNSNARRIFSNSWPSN